MWHVGTDVVDPGVPRTPPPQQTTVRFPDRLTTSPRDWTQESPPPNLQQVFAFIKKAAGTHNFTEEQLDALNITTTGQESSIQDLVPQILDEHWYLAAADGGIQPRESTDRAKLLRATYLGEIRALEVDNAQIYRAVTRTAREHDQRRLINTSFLRPFFGILEQMSGYCDSTLDEYLPGSSGEEPKGQDTSAMQEPSTDQASTSAQESPSDQATSMDLDRPSNQETPPGQELSRDQASPRDQEQSRDQESTSQPALYKGFRTSTLRQMPLDFLNKATHNLLNSPAGAFKLQVTAPTGPLHLKLGRLKRSLDPKDKHLVHIRPKPAQKARSKMTAEDRKQESIRTGPLLACLVREGGHLLANTTGEAATAADRTHHMHELGTLLLLAQERRREDKIEDRNQDKWFVTTSRFGGHAAIAPAVAQKDGLAARAALEKWIHGDAQTGPPVGQPQRVGVLDWRFLVPNPRTWDPSVVYRAVGKEAGCQWDEVS